MEASSRTLYSVSFQVELSSSRSLRYPNACSTPVKKQINGAISWSSSPSSFQQPWSCSSRSFSLFRTRVATDDSTSEAEPEADKADDPATESSTEAEAVSGDISDENAAKSKVEQSVSLLKTAAKTRKVPATEVFSAIRSLEKARIDSSNFLETIGGSGTTRSWMLVFTAGAKVVQEALRGGPGGGGYFPVTAVQQYNAAKKEIQNGVYLGPLGSLEFMGRFSMTKNRLYFMFDTLSLKVGSLGPFKFGFGKKEDEEREPGKKDPFFIWFYADDEIVVGKGRGGGVAVWVRCKRVTSR